MRTQTDGLPSRAAYIRTRCAELAPGESVTIKLAEMGLPNEVVGQGRVQTALRNWRPGWYTTEQMAGGVRVTRRQDPKQPKEASC